MQIYKQFLKTILWNSLFVSRSWDALRVAPPLAYKPNRRIHRKQIFSTFAAVNNPVPENTRCRIQIK